MLETYKFVRSWSKTHYQRFEDTGDVLRTNCVLELIMINFKILFQQICLTKIQWDEEITSDLRQNWDKILYTLENIGKIPIPRDVVKQDINDPIELIELHDFSDASLQNYGAFIYIRAISKRGNVSVNLIASKSRLAPMKQNTIPRLEFLGNILLSRLMNSVKSALSKCILISNCYFWTDSQVTLSWIKT